MQISKALIYVLIASIVALSMGGCQKKETVQINREAVPLVGAPKSPLPTPNIQVSPLSK